MATPLLTICLFSLMLPLTVACVHSAAPPAQAETTKPGLEERQDALLGELAACESGNDPNPDRSGYIGRYQFSTATVIAFVRERDGRTITPAEARSIAHDDAQAGALAKYVIFERGGHSHWPACSRKLGLPAKVAETRQS
jgi:Transglycosylase-like domain